MTHSSRVTSHLEATRIRERFERLLAAGVAIFSRHDLDHVLQEVVDAAREVVGAKYAALGVLGEDRETLVQFVTSGLDEAARKQIGDLPRGRSHEARPGRSRAGRCLAGALPGIQIAARGAGVPGGRAIRPVPAGVHRPGGQAADRRPPRFDRVEPLDRLVLHEQA